jgi:hypothetical protein
MAAARHHDLGIGSQAIEALFAPLFEKSTDPACDGLRTRAVEQRGVKRGSTSREMKLGELLPFEPLPETRQRRHDPVSGVVQIVREPASESAMFVDVHERREKLQRAPGVITTGFGSLMRRGV